MDKNNFISLENLIDSNGLRFSLKEEIKDIFGVKSWKEHIDEFAEFLENIPKDEGRKKPHYTLIFFTSLIIICLHDDKDIAEYIKNKENIFKNLIVGLRILSGGKSKTIRVEAILNHNNYNNKYEYVNSFWIDIYGNGLAVILAIYELIYICDKDMFYELIKADSTNIIYLYFVLHKIILEDEYLKEFLTLDNEIKCNGAFYYLMRKFNNLCRDTRKSLEDLSNNEEVISEEILIKKFFQDLSEERKVYFITNYIFANKISVIPNFFIDTIVRTENLKFVIDFLENQNLSNLRVLSCCYIFIKEVKDLDIQRVFIKYIFNFIDKEVNKFIWDEYKFRIGESIKILHKDVKCELLAKLKNIEDILLITDFDRQIRNSVYSIDMDKKIIIDEIYSITENIE